MTVRDATAADAAACAAIYAPYVTDTAISFELEPPNAEEMATRIAAAQRAYAWVVLEDAEDAGDAGDAGDAEDAGPVVGYVYATPHKARAAYRWSCEVSVYVERG